MDTPLELQGTALQLDARQFNYRVVHDYFYTFVSPDFSLRNGRDIPLTAILSRLLRKGRPHILIHEESIHEQRRNERK